MSDQAGGRRLDFHFDLVSPYAHLVLARLVELPDDVHIRPIATLLGGLLAHHGQVGPAEIPAKRLHTYRHAVFLGDALGRPARFPPRHPFKSLAAMRLLAGANGGDGVSIEIVRTAFDFVFSEGRAIDTNEGLLELADKLGLDHALALADASKAALRSNTDAAITAGVFGVPSFVPVSSEGETGPVFFGVDAFDMLLGYLAEPTLFDRQEFAALNCVSVGIRREKAEAR
ncbi:DsbA family protein [Fulvimarina sp. MAC8]|uniref:2-hydroxychromene-2-carboxylate isomerase n=1 Tax=Fulvimarina sp. MAC8 TaxID=3162874 RepID=UPI0032EA9C28